MESSGQQWAGVGGRLRSVATSEIAMRLSSWGGGWGQVVFSVPSSEACILEHLEKRSNEDIQLTMSATCTKDVCLTWRA